MSLYVITGPPEAGKSTWVNAHVKTGDLVVDFDRLATALTGPDAEQHDHPQYLRATARAARDAAVAEAVQHREITDVYVIHTSPGQQALSRYRAMGANIIVVDPGRDVVLDRCRRMRPREMAAVAARWYAERYQGDVTVGSQSRSW